ncbi:MAG TPA: type II toxin-antitoxin system VapC family toxin [Candidatus Polarisedimenticolaceae bacterium]
MTAVYLETSALLSWLLGEPEAGKVAGVVDAADAVVTSSLTFVEAERALSRAVVERILREADARKLRGVLRRQRAGWIVMAITDPVLDRAGRTFPVEPLRTLDAIHLSTALAFTEAFAELKLVTFDRRIGENAGALGIPPSLT